MNIKYKLMVDHERIVIVTDTVKMVTHNQLRILAFFVLIVSIVDARTKLKDYNNAQNSLRLLHVVCVHICIYIFRCFMFD